MKLPDISNIKDKIGAHIRTFKVKFSKLDAREKNNFILIVSGALIVLAILIAIIGNVASKDKKPDPQETTPVQSTAPVTSDNTTVIASNGGIYKVITQNDPLTVRFSPDTSSSAVGSLGKGTQVEILGVYTDDSGNKFGFVFAPDGSSGWVNMQYTEYVSASTTTTVHGIGTYTVNSSTSDNALNIRRRPDDSNLGGSIANGTKVNVISVCKGNNCEWGLVEYNGEVGWLPFTALA
jgi:uncharacterized protein YgiM (DUF1202 family)